MSAVLIESFGSDSSSRNSGKLARADFSISAAVTISLSARTGATEQKQKAANNIHVETRAFIANPLRG
jgi:hypothetical protein